MGSVGAKQGGSGGAPQEEPEKKGLNHSMKSAEVSQYAKDNLGINIQEKVIGKIGRHKMINSLQLVEDVLNELPESVKKDLGVSVGTQSSNGKWYAKMSGGTGTMWFNTNFFNDNVYKSYQWDVKQKWHPENTTADAIFAHEIGHRLETMAVEKIHGGKNLGMIFDYNDQITAKKIVKDSIEAVKKSTGTKTGSMSTWMNTISGYAASKKNGKYQYHETLAEAVADYAQNKNNAKPLSKEIWSRLKSQLSK